MIQTSNGSPILGGILENIYESFGTETAVRLRVLCYSEAIREVLEGTDFIAKWKDLDHSLDEVDRKLRDEKINDKYLTVPV